jgi:hypothetical protein
MKKPELDIGTLRYIKEYSKQQFLPIDWVVRNELKKLEIEKLATRDNLEEGLFEYQLFLVGKTRMIMVGNDDWREENSIPNSHYKDLRNFSIPLIRKILHINKLKAETAFDKWYNKFGLKIV